MPRRIDTAFVEFLPDFSAFETMTQRELAAIFRQVESIADRSAEDIEDSFDEMGREVKSAFDEASDHASAELRDIGSTADHVAAEVGDDFEAGAEEAERAFAELQRSANRHLNRIDRDVRHSSEATARQFNIGALAGAAAFAGVAAAGAAGLGALTVMGLQSAASFEQTKISFESLLGSMEEGTRVFKQLQDFAATTPFEFPEIADAGKRFLAFNEAVGLTDAQLIGYLTTVGDVISVTGGGAEAFGRINLAIGQIGSTSKVTLENLNQIADAIPGFSPIAAIAQGLGVSTAEAMERISAGSIPAAQGVQLLLQGMQKFPGAAGAMEKQSQTLLGVFSTFKDVIGQTLAEAFAPAIPAIKDALTEVTPIIGEALGQVAPALGNILVGVLPILSDLIAGLAPVLTPILDGLAAGFAAIGPVLKPLGDALGEVIHGLDPLWPVIGKVVQALGESLTPVIAALAPLMLELAEPLAEILLALLPILPPIAELTRAVLLLLTPVIMLASALLSWISAEALVPIITALVDVLNLILEPLSEFTENLENVDWAEIGRDIGGAFTAAWHAVLRFFKAIGTFFKNLPGQVLDFITSLPDRFVDLINAMFDEGLRMIGMGIGLLIFEFTELPGLVIDAIQELPVMLINFLADMWSDAELTSRTALSNIVDFFMELPGKLITALVRIGPVIADFFTRAFNRAKEIVLNAVVAIVLFVRSIPGRIGDFAMDMASNIVSFFKSFFNRAIDRINEGIARIDDILPGSLPRIPRLAHGGVAFGPAIIGEDSSTAPEAAIPLGDQRALALLRDALGTGGTTVNFGPNSIIVTVPAGTTPEQARRIGERVGAGIIGVMQRVDIQTAVRTA